MSQYFEHLKFQIFNMTDVQNYSGEFFYRFIFYFILFFFFFLCLLFDTNCQLAGHF